MKGKRRLVVNLLRFLVLCTILHLSGGCSAQSAVSLNSPRDRTLIITGDVQNEVIVTNYEGWVISKLQYKGESQEVIPLLPLLVEAGITGEGNTVFFSAPDGVIAELPLEEISEFCYLRLTDEYGWQFISDDHPRQAGIKFMDYVVVSATEPSQRANCIRIIDGTKEMTITYGQLFTAEGINRVVFEGKAVKGGLTTNIYSRRTLIPIARYLEDRGQDTAVACYGDGSQGEISLGGFLEWRGNSADYVGPDGKSRRKDIIGILVGAPAFSDLPVP